LIEATSTVPLKTNSRLSVRRATARKPLSVVFARSTVLRALSAWASHAKGRPPREPFAVRALSWSLFSGIVALIPRRRRWERIFRFAYAVSANSRSGRVRGRPRPTRRIRKVTHQRLERHRVMTLSRRDPPGQRPAHEVGQQVNLRAQPAAGTPPTLPTGPTLRLNRLDRRLDRRILVVRPSPLCHPQGMERPTPLRPTPLRPAPPRPGVAQPRAATAPTAPPGCPWVVRGAPPLRAGAPGPPSSRSPPPTPPPGPGHTPPAAGPGSPPTSHRLTSGDAASTPSSGFRRPTADPATAPPCGSATTPHQPPVGDPPTAHPVAGSNPATTAPDAPTQRQSDHDEHA